MEKLYFGGPILTMEEQAPYAEAVLTKNEKIVAVGPMDEVRQRAGKECVEVHLKGRTLCPAFIDGHSHLTMQAVALGMLDLSDAHSFDEIVSRMIRFYKEREVEKDAWILAFGYNPDQLKEKEHPDKTILDQTGIPNPILLTHVSGHMGVTNTRGLAELGISSKTENPSDGRIGRTEDGTEPNGYLEEGVFVRATARIPKTSSEELLKNLERAQALYFSHGITTIQDGLVKWEEWRALKEFSDSGKMKADVIAYVDEKEHAEILRQNLSYTNAFRQHLKIGGYKIFLDGSPQGRTAWLSRPYENAEDGYCGYPIYSDEEVLTYIEKAYAERQQILVHCNGDQAAEQMICCCEKAAAKFPGRDIRPVMIHAQLVRKDQLSRMKKLGIIASFFVAHTWFWGDTHVQNLGNDRAAHISPVRSAIESGVKFNFHQDSPVVPPDMLHTIWCAVNRKTQRGSVLGKEERCTVWEAMSAITKEAAYAYFAEDWIGTLAEGKQADMLLLSDNPLNCSSEALDKIQILQTIKEGEVVFTKEEEK